MKFRAKRIDNDEWVSGSGLLICDDFCVIDRDTEMYEDERYEWAGNTHFFRVAGAMCDLKTIGQYTGLRDKYGKEIYEGDIVKNKEIGGYGMVYIGIVRYYDKDCRFGIDTTTTNKFTKRLLFTDGECSCNDGHCTITYTNEYEVIGNIHDNPELIKEEEK
jgi:uncharacterized phage protein (TIGR01671 family)